MRARTTTFAAQPSNIDAGISHIRDVVLPRLADMGGFVGLSLLVDRQSGRSITTTAWDNVETEIASAERIGVIRDQAAEAFGGPAVVEGWEIAGVHRDHESGEGACVRVTWLKFVPNQVEQSIAFYKTSVLPVMQNLEGFCSATLLINRSSGRAVSSGTFDNQDAMERNREPATKLRNQTRELGADVLDLGEFELAIAHLRVPEMS
jgi:hypothetical protein